MKEKIANTTAKLNATLNNINPNRVNLALKEQCRQCAELGKKISKMEEQINLLSVEVTPVLKGDIHDPMENNLNFFFTFHEIVLEKAKEISLYQPKGWQISPNDYSILAVTSSKISIKL